VGRLIDIANRAGWFADREIPGADLATAVDVLNNSRIRSIHPAAYVLQAGQVGAKASIGERQFATSFAVLEALDEALVAVINDLPDPPKD
jgi:hypothetical protein